MGALGAREHRENPAREISGWVARSISLSILCQMHPVQIKQCRPQLWPPSPGYQAPLPPLTWILGRNAFGFLSRMASTALCRVPSFSRLLKQLRQLHASQYRPDAKHSQYLQYNSVREIRCMEKVQPLSRSHPLGRSQHPLVGSLRRRTHSLRHREFLQLHCFLDADPPAPPLPPPPDLGGHVGVGLRLLCVFVCAWESVSLSQKGCPGCALGSCKRHARSLAVKVCDRQQHACVLCSPRRRLP